MCHHLSLALKTWQTGITCIICIRRERTRASRWTTSSAWRPYSALFLHWCAEGLTAARIENSYGGGFDILSTGPTATDVPVQAVVVDDTSSDIVFQNYSRWFHREDITCSGRTVSFSKGGGTSLSYSFDGVAIWYDCDCVSYIIQYRPNLFSRYYGTRSSDTGFFAVSVDGSTPQRFNGSGYPARYQQMLWSNTRLGPGRHTITLTLDDEDNKDLSLDFFRSVISEMR